MALSIGAVNFGVDANTAGLQKAVAQMQLFKRAVDQVARSQETGASRAAAALGRQESALKKAFQQTLNLQRQLRVSGASVAEVQKTEKAFHRLTVEMSSGQLTTVQFARAMDAFNAKMGRVRRTLADLKTKEAAKDMGHFQKIMRDLESSAVLAVGPLSGVGARIRSLGAIAGRSGFQLVILFGTITALTVGLFKLAAGAVRAERVFEKIEARFMSVSTVAGMADKQMAFVIRTSQQLGLRIEDTAAAFSRLVAATAGTNLEGQDTRDIFLGIAKAAAAMRLETTEVEGIFRAVEQMISKGQVAAEELRGQLGERLPGAFRLFAEGMGLVDDVTGSATQKLNALLKSGEVGTDEILKFARNLDKAFGEQAGKNADTFQGSLNRLSNATLLFNKQFNETFRIGELVAGAINLAARAVEGLTPNIRTAGIAMGALTGAMIAFTAPAILRGLVSVGRLILSMAIALSGAAGAATSAARGMAAIARIGIIIAGGVAGAEAMRRALADVDATLKDIDDTISGSGGTFKALSDGALDVLNNLKAMRTESNELIRTLDSSTGATDTALLKGLFEARKILRQISMEDMPLFTAELQKLNPIFESMNVEEILQTMFSTTEKVEAEWQQLLSRIENTPKALQNVQDEFDYLLGLLDALNRGPRALELFEADDRRAQALARMAEQLKETTLTQEEQNQHLLRYGEILKQVNEAEDKFHTASAEFASALSDGIEDAIFKANDLKDIIRDLGREILKIAVRQFLLAPLTNTVSGALGNVFGGPSFSKPRQFGGLGKGSVLVGETGPEILSLGQTSRITPLNKAGGVHQEIHLHFDVGLESVDSRISQAAPIITQAARDGVMTLMYRPGAA